jgi:hypothetical protein
MDAGRAAAAAAAGRYNTTHCRPILLERAMKLVAWEAELARAEEK